MNNFSLAEAEAEGCLAKGTGKKHKGKHAQFHSGVFFHAPRVKANSDFAKRSLPTALPPRRIPESRLDVTVQPASSDGSHRLGVRGKH